MKEKSPIVEAEEDEEEKDPKDTSSKEKQHKQKQREGDEVIMDLNPKKFEKKDHIFMDFFSMYGQNFIESKRQDKKALLAKGLSSSRASGAHTPFN